MQKIDTIVDINKQRFFDNLHYPALTDEIKQK